MLKQRYKQYIPLVLALVLGCLCAFALMIYADPMEDISLDLSLNSNEDALVEDPADFDNKGWTVYVFEGGSAAELEPDGIGGYTGLELGQTFYLSRVLVEELDSPTLQLSPGKSQFSIWLDDQLIYTDCRDLDNRIGHVQLPMNDWYRSEPISISLPADYQGKTLTIAQSSPNYMETSYVKAWPASIRLYCGYAYESGLISETYTMAIDASLAFLMTMMILVIFVRNRNWSVLCLAVVTFIWMSWKIMGASYFHKYFGSSFTALESIYPLVYTLALVVFLTLRGGTHRKTACVMTGLYGLCVLCYGAIVAATPYIPADAVLLSILTSVIPDWLALGALVCVMVLAAMHWRKENCYYRVFAMTALVTVPFSILFTACTTYRGVLWQQIFLTLSSGHVQMICLMIRPGILAAALLTVITEAVKAELDRRKERHWMEQHQEMAMASYDNLRRQHQEVMMLRHDMMRHFIALRELDNTPQAAEYLDRLIGDNVKIQPVVQSGNKMFDLILNSKISSAKGIQVEILRADIAEKLPLADSELCSLITNLLDNAIDAATRVSSHRQIELDMHMKQSFFVFTCTNSAVPACHTDDTGDTLPRHGMGQKIVQRIAENYDCLLQTTQSENKYSVTVAIPISSK